MATAAKPCGWRSRSPAACSPTSARSSTRWGGRRRSTCGGRSTRLRGEIPRPRIHLKLPDGLAVEDPELAHLLLRCCQEIVTNAAKHAEAANLWLEIAEADGVIGVRARDDGRGAASPAAGRGLTGMRERLERAGGRLEVVTRPGEGFSLAASVPVAIGADGGRA